MRLLLSAMKDISCNCSTVSYVFTLQVVTTSFDLKDCPQGEYLILRILIGMDANKYYTINISGLTLLCPIQFRQCTLRFVLKLLKEDI
jgi:hypothetical protein